MKRSLLAALVLAPLPALAAGVSPLLLHPPRLPGAPAALVAAEVEVSIVLDRAPDAAMLAALAAAGAVPVRLADGSPALVGEVLGAVVHREQLETVGAVPGVLSVEPASPLTVIRPLVETTAQLGVPSIWHPALSGVPNLGEGIVIGDYEGAWDIFHPDLFFPDGGLYAFTDVDGDGVAGEGDLVDLDGDGTPEAPLSLVGGPSSLGAPEVENPPGFDPGIEWLYVDLDGNGERDHGAAKGFDDTVPAFGEPIFAGDDVDADGKLQVGERLVRLGTSKVRAISVDAGSSGVKLYERGVDLSSYVPALDPYHGTGTTGIVAGGWPGLRRWTGVAPGAELFLAANRSPAVALGQAKEVGVDVMFWEQNDFGTWDGSSAFERAVSSAAAGGMIQVAPAGNAAAAGKSMEIAPLEGTETVRVSTVGRGYRGFYLWISFPGSPEDVDLVVEAPDGSSADFTGLGSQAPQLQATAGGAKLQAYASQSTRGFSSIVLVAAPAAGSTLPQQEVTLRLTSAGGVERLRGFLWDDLSGWSRGVSFLDHESDAGSAMAPSTADTVIAVSAHGGVMDMDVPGGGAAGARRGYAGMGPRIDGAPLIDISSPDDPIAPMSTAGLGHGAYFRFGGTSGATPHVAGVAALLRAAQPDLSHDEVEAILTGSARRDSYTGEELPNESYGYGKLDAAAAILGQPVEPGAPPALRLEVVGAAWAGRPITLRAVVDDADGDGAQASVSWDVGYDRSYEAGPANLQEHTFTVDAPGLVPVVAEVIDPTGRSARARLEVEVVEAPPFEEDGGGEGGGCNGSGPEPVAWILPALPLLLRRRRLLHRA
ncbi:S8 family serine peptidase [Vulgatibacter sp.]|uniref:S8 family serine peptidase n=1 Tax=Vulgatibacter sp. TaxID=1971226 RepID=UPI00356328C2